MWCLVTKPVKTFLLGILVTRDKMRGSGGLRKGVGLMEPSEDGRVWSQPGTSKEPKLLILPGPPSGPCSPEGQAGNPEEEGPGPLATLDAVSFFLQSCRLRNVPKLGARKPGPWSSSLNPAVIQEPGGSRLDRIRVDDPKPSSQLPYSLQRGMHTLLSQPLSGGRYGRLVLVNVPPLAAIT